MRDLAGKSGFKVWALNEQTLKLEAAEVSRAFTTGRKRVYRLRTRLGRTIRATSNHKFRTFNGWERLDELEAGNALAAARSNMAMAGISIGHRAMVAAFTCNVHWDEIISIEPDRVEDVYDLTVPGPSNFVANDVVVHNSLEQDADVVMFIYRESMYKPDSKRPNVAEIHIRKHRNGPTGTIELFFNAQQVRFQNLAKPAGNRPPPGSPPPPLAQSAPPLTALPAAPSMPTT
jgi:replicative DNA helicase